jgi:membrane protein DedA with SNARE-associated domain
MNRFGYIGIALLIAIENIFPPIPSEIILTFGGFMTTQSNMNIWLVSLFATVGSVTGAIVLYFIGRLLTPKRFGWLVDKWGHILRVKKDDIKRAERWFIKRGSLTVFFCRFIPIVRSLISIPAGTAHMNFGKFLLFTTLGTAIWNIVLVKLGAVAGENWQSIVNYMDTYSYIVWAAVAVAIIVIVILYVRKKKIEKASNKSNK